MVLEEPDRERLDKEYDKYKADYRIISWIRGVLFLECRTCGVTVRDEARDIHMDWHKALKKKLL